MKVKLYCDLPDAGLYTEQEHVFFYARPCKKIDGYTRYRIIVDLPDKHFTPDSVVDVDTDIIEKVREV